MDVGGGGGGGQLLFLLLLLWLLLLLHSGYCVVGGVDYCVVDSVVVIMNVRAVAVAAAGEIMI